MKLYSGYVWARKALTMTFATRSIVGIAEDKVTARTKAMEVALESFPVAEGWTYHAADISEVNDRLTKDGITYEVRLVEVERR